MAKRFDGVKRGEWRKRLEKFAESGLTVREFCRREHVSQASFYYWAKRLRAANKGEATVTRSVTATRGTQRKDSVSTPDEVSHDFVEVLVGDSIRVRMPTNRLGAVAALVKDLQAAAVDEPMRTSRFQRIRLASPTTSS